MKKLVRHISNTGMSQHIECHNRRNQETIKITKMNYQEVMKADSGSRLHKERQLHMRRVTLLLSLFAPITRGEAVVFIGHIYWKPGTKCYYT